MGVGGAVAAGAGVGGAAVAGMGVVGAAVTGMECGGAGFGTAVEFFGSNPEAATAAGCLLGIGRCSATSGCSACGWRSATGKFIWVEGTSTTVSWGGIGTPTGAVFDEPHRKIRMATVRRRGREAASGVASSPPSTMVSISPVAMT
jgi:hypothetical protein